MDSDLTGASLQGRYFDGRSTRPSLVTVTLDAGRLNITGEAIRSWQLDAVTVSERLGRSQRRIVLPEGGLIEVADHALLDRLPQQWGQSGMRLAWLESRWRYVLAGVVGIVFCGWVFYVYGLPWAAERIAAQIPTSWVDRLSTSTLETVDRFYTEPSKLAPARRKEIADAFAAWAPPGGGPAPAYKLHFRDGKRIGPNAFALPSGDIVITDQLIKLAGDDREILGVLAHELGHLEKRHGLRQLMQSAIMAIAANVLLGDMGDMTGTAAALLNLRYSRGFETEADDYAASMMRDNHVDPGRLADMLKRLDPGGASDEDKLGGYMATHPVTAERIKRLQNPSSGQVSKP